MISYAGTSLWLTLIFWGSLFLILIFLYATLQHFKSMASLNSTFALFLNILYFIYFTCLFVFTYFLRFFYRVLIMRVLFGDGERRKKRAQPEKLCY